MLITFNFWIFLSIQISYYKTLLSFRYKDPINDKYLNFVLQRLIKSRISTSRSISIDTKTIEIESVEILSHGTVSYTEPSTIDEYPPKAIIARKSKECLSSYILSLVEIYKSIYKDVKIPSSFCVPSDSVWPKFYWGVPLGRRLVDIRRNKTGKL
jgi:hypothetical protein